MQLLAGFEVPTQVMGDFVQNITGRGMTASVTGTKYPEIQVVTVPYEKEEEDEINELNDYLGELISSLDEEDEEESEEQ
jgi:hypothetical protein